MAILAHDRQTAMDDGLALATDVFPPHLVMRARNRRRDSADKPPPLVKSPDEAPKEAPEDDMMTDNYDCGAPRCAFAACR
jgi:hypothetical protein